jgi:hypothetical protein
MQVGILIPIGSNGWLFSTTLTTAWTSLTSISNRP